MARPRTLPDESSRERLISSHLPLVRSIARRYLGRGEDLEDLVQIGAVGLVKASDRFDPERRVAFAAFAAPTIEGEIRNHLRDRTPAVTIPREQEQTRRALRQRRDELTSALAREPTVSELAVSLGVEDADVERALAAERARDLVSVSTRDAQDQPVEAETPPDSDDRLVLASSLRSLDERGRRIVFLRFHADMTERQIARELGISQAHVSRLLSTALEQLRAELGRQGLERDTTGDTTGDVSGPGGIKLPAVGEPEDPGSSSGQESEGSKAAHSYSGRFLVRMPQSLHEQLAQAAEREQISLNRLVTNLLTAAVSEGDTEGSDSGPAADRSGTPRISPRTFRLALATNLIVVILAGIIAVVLLVLALERGI